MKFIKGDLIIPKDSFLVFVINQQSKVITSASLEFINDKEFTVDENDWIDADVDLHQMELRINNELINNVRWFDTSLVNNKYKLQKRKNIPGILIIHYILFILTIGIWACIYINKKQKKLDNITSNLDSAQEELCEINHLANYARQVQEVTNNRKIEEIERISNVFKDDADIVCTEKLTQDYGNLTQVQILIEELKEYKENRESAIEKIGSYEEIEAAIELKEEYGHLQKFKSKIESFQQLERQTQRLGEDLSLAIQLKEEFGPYNKLFKTLYEYQLIKEKINKLENIDEAIEIKSTFGSLSLLKNELEALKELKNSFGSLQNIKNSLNNLREFETQKENYRKILSDSETLKDECEQKTKSLQLIKNKIQQIGSEEEIETLIELKSEFGHINRLQQAIKEYKRIKEQITRLENIEEAINLKNTFGNLLFIKNELEALRELKNNYGSIENINIKLKNLNKLEPIEKDYLRLQESEETLKQKNEQTSLLLRQAELKLSSLGTEEDIEKALALKTEFGSLSSSLQEIRNLKNKQLQLGNIDEALELKNNYGSIAIIKETLENFKTFQIKHGSLEAIENKLESYKNFEKLKYDKERLEEREKRWKEFAKGKDLEYWEESQQRKEEENRTKTGLDFERNVEDTLNYIKDELEGKLEIIVEPQFHIKDKRNADFLVSFFDKSDPIFRLLIECKNRNEAKEEINELFNDNNIKRDDETIQKWIKQLCDNYSDSPHAINLGIIVTNSNLDNLSEKGIRKIRINEKPKKYQLTYMNIFFVHYSALKSFMIILNSINNTYEAPTEFTREEKRTIFEDPKFIKFLKHLNEELLPAKNKIEQAMKNCEKIQHQSRIAVDNLKKYFNSWDIVVKSIQQLHSEADYYSNKIPKLEFAEAAEIIETTEVISLENKDEKK